MSQRTYWHLEPNRKVPSSYEIATSKLLYYPEKGFGYSVTLKDWYARYQTQSKFNSKNMDLFVDPRATTYTKYVELQKNKEIFVDQIFEQIEQSNYDQTLSEDWIQNLDLVLPQLRFLYHGLQMVSAYVGQMAPSSRVTIAAALQASDEMRRIQRIAYRMRQLQNTFPLFGVYSKKVWEEDRHWQPLRRLMEELLITYDWGEAFIALNRCIKPQVDFLFQTQLAKVARKSGDYQLANVLMSLHEDSRWHQQWSEALIKTMVKENPTVQDIVMQWIFCWEQLAREACQPLKEKISWDI